MRASERRCRQGSRAENREYKKASPIAGLADKLNDISLIFPPLKSIVFEVFALLAIVVLACTTLEGALAMPLQNARAPSVVYAACSSLSAPIGVGCNEIKSNFMEPVTTITAAWTVVKTAGEISKRLYEFGKSLKDREAKHQVDEMLDKLRELKQSASEVEDENRGLREKLRFKSDAYEFRTPFYYDKARDHNHLQPLCPKCFAKDIAAPMSEQGLGCAPEHRRCLVCDEVVQVENRPPRQSAARRTPWK